MRPFFSWKEKQNTLETDCAAECCGPQDQEILLLERAAEYFGD
jgi:hypothetical protein